MFIVVTGLLFKPSIISPSFNMYLVLGLRRSPFKSIGFVPVVKYPAPLYSQLTNGELNLLDVATFHLLISSLQISYRIALAVRVVAQSSVSLPFTVMSLPYRAVTPFTYPVMTIK